MSCAFLHSYGAVCDACAGCQSACAVRAGAVGRAVGTGARRFSSRLHSATANPPSSARGNPSAVTARLAWSRCLPAPIASVPAASCPSRHRIRSGPVAGTPHPCALSAHVRFCGARSAPLTVSKVSALTRNCTENILDFHSVGTCFRLAQSWITMRTRAHLSPKCIHEVSVANVMLFNATHYSSRANEGRSGLEGRRHEAEAVTAGDADAARSPPPRAGEVA